MRPVIVAGNWKMNTTPADAAALAVTIAGRTRESSVVRVLCPPFVCLAVVRDALATADVAAPDGQGVFVGAQDVHHEPAGAYTGWISAPMLIGLATWVIVGHSERRRDAGETDEVIGRKLLAARAHGLRTILCVGEQLAEREAGRALEVVDRQVRACLSGADPRNLGMDGSLPWLTIAYEPVWAIGTGRTARGSDAAAMADAIRSTLGALGFPDGGDAVPILYGGSVTSAAIGEFLAEHAIDGALVGGASLKPDEMAGIVARAAVTARAREGATRA
ncbi:MAG TPA: triose-phosphate isomerase [Candidatus Eisenbacteria bacterium]|nr:triose-phosphate isomerase [Candidatus Eisenbacteria bacterium]